MQGHEAGRGASEGRFNAIYDKHHRAVHAYLLGRTGDSEVTLDLLQEVFLRVWRHLDVLQARGEERDRYWIFTVAKNLASDHYRAQAVRSTALETPASAQEPGMQTSQSAEAEFEEHEEQQMLNRAIQHLPEDLRTVLLLQSLGGLTSGEVGEALGKPAGTIRYQTHLARKRIAEELRLIERGSVQEASYER